jgi:hypothetical protein
MYEGESVDDDIITWIVSNMLYDVNNEVFIPMIVRNRMEREVQNLLSKLDTLNCLNIILKD